MTKTCFGKQCLNKFFRNITTQHRWEGRKLIVCYKNWRKMRGLQPDLYNEAMKLAYILIKQERN